MQCAVGLLTRDGVGSDRHGHAHQRHRADRGEHLVVGQHARVGVVGDAHDAANGIGEGFVDAQVDVLIDDEAEHQHRGDGGGRDGQAAPSVNQSAADDGEAHDSSL